MNRHPRRPPRHRRDDSTPQDCRLTGSEVGIKLFGVEGSLVCFVIIAGIGACEKAYYLLAEALNLLGFACIVVSPPGYGNRDFGYGAVSVAAAIEPTLRALCGEKRRLIWAGHSAGYAAAVLLAAAAPKQTAGTISVCGDLMELNRSVNQLYHTLRHIIKWARLQGVLQLFKRQPREALLQRLERGGLLTRLAYWPLVAHPSKLEPANRELLVRHCGHYGGWELFRENQGIDYRELLKAICHPVLFVTGRRDPWRDRVNRRSFQTQLASFQAQLPPDSAVDTYSVVFDGCSHLPNLECVARLAKAMADFARKLGFEPAPQVAPVTSANSIAPAASTN